LGHSVYFNSLKANHRYEIPTWFTEGIAEYASGDTEFLGLVEQALRDNTLILLTELSSPSKRFLVHPIVYGEGQSAFQAVEARYGKEDVRALVNASYRHNMDGSFQEAIQKGLSEFEREWVAYLREKFAR